MSFLHDPSNDQSATGFYDAFGSIQRNNMEVQHDSECKMKSKKKTTPSRVAVPIIAGCCSSVCGSLPAVSTKKNPLGTLWPWTWYFYDSIFTSTWWVTGSGNMTHFFSLDWQSLFGVVSKRHHRSMLRVHQKAPNVNPSSPSLSRSPTLVVLRQAITTTRSKTFTAFTRKPTEKPCWSILSRNYAYPFSFFGTR